MAFTLLAGVYPRELDLTLQGKAITTSIGGAIVLSRKGPEEDRFLTRVEIWDDLYGRPDASWSFDHYCVRQFLIKGQGMWIKRISRGARHAGSVVYNNRDGVQASNTYFTGFGSGRFENYRSGSQKLLNLQFSAALVASNVASVTFTNGTTNVTASATFTTSSDNTLRLLALDITAKLNASYVLSGRNNGRAFVNTVGASTSDDRMLTIIIPEDADVTISDVTVSGGASQATATMYENSTIMEVYAENRGRWGSDVGYKILNVDNGINQRVALNFSTNIASGQAFALRVTAKNLGSNELTEVVVGPITYATSHAATIAAIAAAIKTALGGATDAYVNPTNGMQILVSSPFDGPETLSFLDFTWTGGGSAPTVTAIETIGGIDRTQSFEFQVFTRDDINNYKETRTVSFLEQIDGNGTQLFIEEVINNNSSSRSDYVRVKYNKQNASGVMSIPSGGTPIVWCSGGDDGTLPTTGDIVLAWDAFKDRRKRPMRILINNGHTAIAVQQKMTALATKRYDCIAVLDNPSAYQEAQAAFENRNNNINIDSSYAAFYTPDLLYTDEYSSKQLYIPPSGHVAAQYAETDERRGEWFAPAGLNNAVLDNIQGLREEYDEEQMNLLLSCQLNPIINRDGDIVIWDQRTALRRESAFSNVSLRRTLITIEVSIVDGLDYTIHEPNDSFTALKIVSICVGVLQPMKAGRALYSYGVVSDDRNNKDYDYNLQRRNVAVILDPILPIRTIILTAAVTKKSASFTETIAAITGGTA